MQRGERTIIRSSGVPGGDTKCPLNHTYTISPGQGPWSESWESKGRRASGRRTMSRRMTFRIGICFQICTVCTDKHSTCRPLTDIRVRGTLHRDEAESLVRRRSGAI